MLLEGAARYAGLLLAPAEGFGQAFFCPSGQKKRFLYYFGPHFCDFLKKIKHAIFFFFLSSNFKKIQKKYFFVEKTAKKNSKHIPKNLKKP